MISEKSEEIAYTFADERIPAHEWDMKGLTDAVFKQFNFRLEKPDGHLVDGMDAEKLAELIFNASLDLYSKKEALIGAEDIRQLERFVMLQTVDNLWKDHLLSMDHLKEGIGLRGYAQQNPLLVYKKEGFDMFQDMISKVKDETVEMLFKIQISEPEVIADYRQQDDQDMIFSSGEEPETKKPVKRDGKKVGRNAPCPCGSGKKYKKCCGA
jgi:preprotein translocase subunit SecA